MRAYVSCVLSQPVDEAWRVLGDFHSIAEWAPTIVRSEVDGTPGRSSVGSVRVLHRKDGAVIRERLVSYDDHSRCLSYEFSGQSRFGVRRLVATIGLRPVTSSDGTFLEWFADFDADEADEDEMRATLESVYVGLIDALRHHLDHLARA